jgi:ABC-2 type transport system ATP-binding protein
VDTVIHTENLGKRYPKGWGVRDINLEVKRGEVYGFLGPNGAGKTTTVRTILDFLRPSSGRASVFGLDSRRDSVAIRARVGNLPTEFTLDDMVGEDLLALFARLRGVRDLSYARELAERLGAQLDRPMRRLSRGNKQKIGLLLAMFHRPPLLMLDEPTGGLDPLVQEEFLSILREVKGEGRTVFFSSHVLSEVERVCDRVGVIRGGRLVAVETTAELLSRQFRRVTLTFAAPVDPAPFAAHAGIRDLSADGPSLRFTLHDGLGGMVKLAARHDLVDMALTRPSLEEVFLSYYGEQA